jgi:hypothetical protein
MTPGRGRLVFRLRKQVTLDDAGNGFGFHLISKPEN